MKATITIPYPAWDGIFRISDVVNELRRSSDFLGQVLPEDLNNPRRITLRQAPPPGEGNFDDCLVVDYWWPGGFYATATLAGRDTHYGTTWQIINLRLRWDDPRSQGFRSRRLRLDIRAVEEIAPLTGFGRGDEALPEIAAAIERRVRESEATG